MAAQFDRADSDGLLRHSGAGDSQTMHSDEWDEQEEMYVDTSSEALEFSEARRVVRRFAGEIAVRRQRVTLSVKEEC